MSASPPHPASHTALHTAVEPPFPHAKAAATLVIMRCASTSHDSHDSGNIIASSPAFSPASLAPDEILMVRRAKTMAFAAGAAVFPGGRVDDDDYIVAAMHGYSPCDIEAASRVAALRETLEETGLAIGWQPLSPRASDKRLTLPSSQNPATRDMHGSKPDRAPSASARAIDYATARRDLLRGVLFSDILVRYKMRLALHSLYYFARWCPQRREARIFDTRFFAVAAPHYDHELTVEQSENSHIFWSSAANALAMAERGEIKIIFPTRRNLERLRCYPSYQDFVAAPLRLPIPCVIPMVATYDGTAYLSIPTGLGYPITREPLDQVRRG